MVSSLWAIESVSKIEDGDALARRSKCKMSRALRRFA